MQLSMLTLSMHKKESLSSNTLLKKQSNLSKTKLRANLEKNVIKTIKLSAIYRKISF